MSAIPEPEYFTTNRKPRGMHAGMVDAPEASPTDVGPKNNSEREQRLAAEEKIIAARAADGVAAWADVGRALSEINTWRLYPPKVSSFDAYVTQRWGMSRIHAYRLMAAAKVLDNLKCNPGVTAPTSEKQIRPLAKLKLEDQLSAWLRALTLHGPCPSSRQVSLEAESVAPKVKPISPNVKPVAPHAGATEPEDEGETAVVEVVAKVDDVEKPTEKHRLTIDEGWGLWLRAKSILDQISKRDQSREEALKAAHTYINARLTNQT